MKNTELSSAAIKAGIRDMAMEWALTQGGRGNPVRFANAYEYFVEIYNDYKDSLDYDDLRKDKKYQGKSNKEIQALKFLEVQDRDSAYGIVDQNLKQDLATLEQSGWGPTYIDPTLEGDALVDAVRRSRHLGFSDPVGAAYHARKHIEDIPESELTAPTEIENYLNSVSITVRDGKFIGFDKDDATGSRTLKFMRQYPDGNQTKTVMVIVGTDSDGRTVVKTSYGVKPGDLEPDGEMPPEWRFLPPVAIDSGGVADALNTARRDDYSQTGLTLPANVPNLDATMLRPTSLRDVGLPGGGKHGLVDQSLAVNILKRKVSRRHV